MHPNRARLGHMLAVVAAAAALLAACAATEPREKSAGEWYEQGRELAERGKTEAAVEAFREAAKGYRSADLDADIQIALADALFDREDHAASVEAYREFLRLHPHNSRADWAQYRIGLAWMRQIRGPDRTQEPARAAVSAFDALLRGYPRSSWLEEAGRLRDEARRRLAEHELYVGEFYLRRGSFLAAAGRFEAVLRDYAGLGFGDRALFRLGTCYERLSRREEASEIRERLRLEFPESPFLRELDNQKG